MEQHEEIKRLDEAGDDALRLEDIKMKLLESKDFRDLGLDARSSLAINLHGACKGHCDVRHSPWLTRIVCSLTFGFAEPLGGLGGEFNPGGDVAHAEHSVTMVIQALNDVSRKCKERGMGANEAFFQEETTRWVKKSTRKAFQKLTHQKRDTSTGTGTSTPQRLAKFWRDYDDE